MNTQIHLTPARQFIETCPQAIKIWQGSENTEMQQLWRRRNATDMSAISTKLFQTENARIARNRRNAIFAKLVVSLCLNLTFIQILKTPKLKNLEMHQMRKEIQKKRNRACHILQAVQGQPCPSVCN